MSSPSTRRPTPAPPAPSAPSTQPAPSTPPAPSTQPGPSDRSGTELPASQLPARAGRFRRAIARAAAASRAAHGAAVPF
jgi:hypothetical protein